MLLTSSHICKPTQSTWDLFTLSLKHIVIIEPHGSSEFQALQVIFQAAFYLTFVLQCLLGLTVFWVVIASISASLGTSSTIWAITNSSRFIQGFSSQKSIG